MTPDEIARRDLIRACVHEAAHAHVAGTLGYHADWRVTKTDASNIYQEKAWVGQTRFFQQLSPDHEKLIGLAGSIAEEFMDDPSVCADDLLDYLQSGAIELSSTDAQYTGEIDELAVSKTLELVKGAWNRILTDAERRAAVYIDSGDAG